MYTPNKKGNRKIENKIILNRLAAMDKLHLKAFTMVTILPTNKYEHGSSASVIFNI